MFKNYINSQKQNIVNSICDLITFPSVSEETSKENMPFGKACADSLKYFLNLATSLGFKTKNVDGYCGWAEFGEGKELIGIIGHLDVVPAIEEDWNHSPFIPTVENNLIYGRGAIDDKGPVIGSLYAMKTVMDYCISNNIKINKRVRLIVGLNEEKDWKCIEYYKTHEEIPTLGFSPDADFPCIYAEKSILSILLSQKLTDSKITIEDVDCANNALNVVPKYCSLVLSINDASISTESIIELLKTSISNNNYEIDIYKIDNCKIKLTSYGVSAHSAHPDLGVNAISRLLIILAELFENLNITTYSLINTFSKYIGTDNNGTKMNMNFKDESGILTMNPSQIYMKDNKLNIAINLRIPVSVKITNIENIFKNVFENSMSTFNNAGNVRNANSINNFNTTNKTTINTNIKVSTINSKPALYINKNNTLVKKLCEIYNSETNSNLTPIAIGGATYARAFPNCISFGMNFPGDTDMCHQADEFVDIDKLLLATNIYAKAIYELLNY